MTQERKAELAKQLVAIIFELTSAGEVPSDVMPVQQPKKPVEMLTLKESLDVIPGLSIVIGNPLKLSSNFPPLYTVHESFPLIRRAIIHYNHVIT